MGLPARISIIPRKKPPTPPLLALKPDFVQALDDLVAQVVVFRQAVETALALGAVGKNMGPTLQTELDKLDKLLMGD